MNTNTTIVSIIALTIIGVAYVLWVGSMDDDRARAAEAYEKCVRAEYGMHPTAYYDQNNAWPECDATKYLNNEK